MVIKSLSKLSVLLYLLTSIQANAYAGVIVIANNSSKISTASSDDLMKLFLGKSDSIGGESKLKAIDQSESSAVKEKFYNAISSMDKTKLERYWAKQTFTGKGNPPQSIGNDADVIKYVSANPNAIGYIDDAKPADGVKVIFKIP